MTSRETRRNPVVLRESKALDIIRAASLFCHARLLCGLLWAMSMPVLANDTALKHAVGNWFPGATIIGSSVFGDIDCDGKKDISVLASSESGVIVAVFLKGRLSARPTTLAFDTKSLEFDTKLLDDVLKLKSEALDVRDAEFIEMLGERPVGYVRSHRCKGLELVVDDKDPFHIYWDRHSHRLSFWRL